MKEIDSGGAEDLSQIKLGDLSDDELRFLCLIRSSDKLFSKAKRLLRLCGYRFRGIA